MTHQIYLITNTVNGKQYVGQTLDLRGITARFSEHVKCAAYRLRLEIYIEDVTTNL